VSTRAIHVVPPASSRLRWWREVAYILAFYGVYTLVRNLQEGDTSRARANALHVIHVEKFLGIYHEHAVQHWFGLVQGVNLHHIAWRTFIQFWNVYYGSAHFIVTIVAIVWLFRTDKARYPLWRNTLAFTTALALIGFAFFPLMPPRLMADHGFVDTLRQVGGLWSFDSGPMAKVSNQYAAMPSLHFAWATWCLLVFWPALKRPWQRALVIAHPALTLFGIVVTANHYFLDAVGGALVLCLGFAMARVFTAAVDARGRVAGRGVVNDEPVLQKIE
jgi:hypothetical protein